jgi:hypothetical protein
MHIQVNAKARDAHKYKCGAVSFCLGFTFMWEGLYENYWWMNTPSRPCVHAGSGRDLAAARAIHAQVGTPGKRNRHPTRSDSVFRTGFGGLL